MRIEIDVLGKPDAAVGFDGVAVNPGYFGCGYRQSAGNIGDFVSYGFHVPNGAGQQFLLDICHARDHNRGIYAIFADNKEATSRIDGYGPALMPNQIDTVDLGFLADGEHTIEIQMVGKNTDADGQYGQISSHLVIRSA